MKATCVRAPGTSPPRQNPCTILSATINALAATPHRAYAGTSPMASVAPDITNSDQRKTRRLP